VVSSLYGQQVTAGEIIAHSVSINSLEQIINIYEKLLPGYRNALPSVHECWIEDRDLPERTPIIKDADHVLATMRRLFEVRHIVTHELPREKPYVLEELSDYIVSADAFLNATDWYTTGQLKGDVPRTQLTMNQLANGAVEAKREEMRHVLNAIAKQNLADPNLLYSSQEAWLKYLNAESDLRASIVRGGSMYPMVWSHQMAELVDARTKSLQAWLEELAAR